MSIGKGLEHGHLTSGEIHRFIHRGLNSLGLDGKRVLVIIPDSTRTMPMPLAFSSFARFLGPRVKQLDYLVALGTHPPLDDWQLSKLVGHPVLNGRVGKSRIFNHTWQKSATITHIGTLSSRDIASLTGGLLSQAVPVQINRLIFNYDHLIICGPVFPHEVAGFSGGNKYFFPGIAGPDIINFTHWLGALVTNYKIIGNLITPVRVVINHASRFVHTPSSCFAFVNDYDGVAGLYFGAIEEAWTDAARLSAIRHIIYKSKPYTKVIACMPGMYADLWTAAKGMYKLEPVIADQGEVVIYAPHIQEVSFTYGKLIDEIGYHCRDYFLAQWKRFEHYPAGVLAHSTHLTGLGEYDPTTRIETPRIRVTLATGIPEARCHRLNLGYQDPASIDLQAWQDREEEAILVVPRAGEILYRLQDQVKIA
jgi:nickel-dependent lactate racemase